MAPGARGASLYRTGAFEIDLVLLPSGNVRGQVVCHEADWQPEGCYCMLYGEGLAEAAELSSAGEFLYASVKPGRYLLVVRTETIDVVVPDIEFGVASL